MDPLTTSKRKSSSLTSGQIALRVVNVVFLVLLAAGIIWIVVAQGCHKLSPRPAPSADREVDVEHILHQVNGLNVITNLLIAVPGIILLVIGFPLEGIVVLLCTLFSCLWHASGWRVFAYFDQVFASFALITMLVIFLRICQVRGYPEFTAFYLTLPAAGLLMFAAGDAGFITNDGLPDPSGATQYISQRMSHTLWHVLTGAIFLVLTIELLRTPDLLPNRRLASAVRSRDTRMYNLTWKKRGSKGRGPDPTIIGGLLADLFATSVKTSVS